MQSLFFLGTLISLVAAASPCTLSSGKSFLSVYNLNSGSSSSLGDYNDFLDNLSSQLNSATLSSANLISSAAGRKVKRATLACNASESCYYISDDAFCFDDKKFIYRDLDITWNIMTGDYVLADGTKGNVDVDGFPSASPSVVTIKPTSASIGLAAAPSGTASGNANGSGGGSTKSASAVTGNPSAVLSEGGAALQPLGAGGVGRVGVGAGVVGVMVGMVGMVVAAVI